MKGIINVNKPQDWTSFDVVNYLKKMLHIRRIGHLGTLDPMATGVLPVTIGSATKLFDMFLNKTKTYVAKFEFGYRTDTLDATGCVEGRTDIIPSEEDIKRALKDFVGNIEQMPPQYSAKKVNGKKACDVARTGGVVELKPKLIYIKGINFISYIDNVLECEIECGAGTYIRAIGRDLAEKLGSLATMTSLIRTRVGVFDIKDTINLKEESIDTIISRILPTDVVFDCPIINDEEIVKKLLNGQIISNFDISNIEINEKHKNMLDNDVGKIKDNNQDDYKMFRLYLNDEFVAVATLKDGRLKMINYFV